MVATQKHWNFFFFYNDPKYFFNFTFKGNMIIILIVLHTSSPLISLFRLVKCCVSGPHARHQGVKTQLNRVESAVPHAKVWKNAALMQSFLFTILNYLAKSHGSFFSHRLWVWTESVRWWASFCSSWEWTLPAVQV